MSINPHNYDSSFLSNFSNLIPEKDHDFSTLANLLELDSIDLDTVSALTDTSAAIEETSVLDACRNIEQINDTYAHFPQADDENPVKKVKLTEEKTSLVFESWNNNEQPADVPTSFQAIDEVKYTMLFYTKNIASLLGNVDCSTINNRTHQKISALYTHKCIKDYINI